SVDDIARLRAGRILLNDPPPVDTTQPPSEDQELIEGTMLEALIRGNSTPVSATDCIIRTLYRDRDQWGDEFLRIARLGAIFMLKAGGVVEQIHRLLLGPLRGGKVHVDFEGARRKMYTNLDPTIIRVEGDCPLA